MIRPHLPWSGLPYMQQRTIRDIDLRGKRVLLRVDYNVQVEAGKVVDDLRLRESIPTITFLREQGARIVICSHRGRPRGEVVEALRNAPVAAHLAKLLGLDVATADDCVGERVQAAVNALGAGDILLLENVRFHAEEEADDPKFAKRLASLADAYVNDAFGTAHRAHASIVGVPKYLPAVAGLLLEREVDILTRVSVRPERPFGLVLGGAKIADKIQILTHLCENADVICVGGGIANTFLKADGVDVGDSLVDDAGLPEARHMIELARTRHDLELVLPADAVVAFGTAEGGSVRTVPARHVPSGWRILDIGPATVDEFQTALEPMRTVVWNGPVGLFEREPFDRGSLAIARLLADLDATTVVGGGETAAAVQRAGVQDRLTHVSTGGGASLAMMQGHPLPGVRALNLR